MPKKKSWFYRVTDFLFPVKDDKETQLKNNKKKRRLFGSTRTTKNPPSLPLVAPSLSRERTEMNVRPLDEAEVSSNTTAAAAAAAAAAQYPSLSLPSSSTSAMQLEEYVASKILLCRAQLLQHVEDLAAIKIQTAFRGYLARKALRALKGLVRLQAIIRGRAVRRQAVATLKSLQSIVNIQSQVCATRYQKANENKQYDDPRDVKFKIEQSGRRRRDHTLLMNDEQNAIILSKTEAMMRRNRLKAFPFNHRHSADVEDARVVGRLRQWLEESDEHEVPMKEEIKRVDIVRLGNAQSVHQAATDQESTLAPRRSYDSRKHRDISNLGDKIDPKPAYMAATESARARVRSMGSARLVRPTQLESYSDGDSPYKSKLSPMSSINSERNWGGALVRSGSYRQRSYTGFKGVGGSMRFNRNVTDSGPDNGRLLLNWN